MEARKPKTIKRKDGKPRAFTLTLPCGGTVDVYEGTDRGRPADVILAPAGTKVKPKVNQ